MFWKKKNTIVVDVYTDRTEMFEAYQPMLARKFIPDWWKNLPQHREADMPGYKGMPVATMKGCPAINGCSSRFPSFPAGYSSGYRNAPCN